MQYAYTISYMTFFTRKISHFMCISLSILLLYSILHKLTIIIIRINLPNEKYEKVRQYVNKFVFIPEFSKHKYNLSLSNI